ncbi:MAG: valine--tRNA ligase [Rhizobiales bacterium]|nr:valine--tRNA ligase [Hyphomicrobiales bacterium]
MLDKTFDPAAIEARISEKWEQAGAFRAGPKDRVEAGAPTYCIVIPPPNVTGSLHMGHALNNTLQDVLCRFERMRGKDVLWQPGTDHAGIATQMVVERQLMQRQEPDRHALGRDKFIERIWAWKEESGGAIVNQLKRLGASCDWSRERFTMDEGLSAAVRKVFVELHRAGLIYKDKRLVNWDPKFQTAISDLEVVQVEASGKFKWDEASGEPLDLAALGKLLDKDPSGHMYHLRYPLSDDPSRFIVVATTRPETMLGDTGVAVHPEDERYKGLVGKTVTLPLVGRQIPIVADEYSDPEKGTGAVKITPAHDFNDFEVGKRHGLAQINVLDGHAAVIAGADAEEASIPDVYWGLDRFAARKRVVANLHSAGLLARIEPTTHTVPHGDRSNVVIEPWLTDQWYVDAKTMAEAAIAAVESGETKFVPENWSKTYFEWMRNIEPWCISRQLWWGHQIPAWHGPDGKIFVADSDAEAQALAKAHYGSASELTRDPDVLDTWFSSALWPFSTLGWPDETPELARYYPTSVLVTGFDIIFFWVARMMMMGLHFRKEIPFHTVYIHALVRDEKGQKMSKSKGNVMDPLDIVDGIDLDALLVKRTSGLMNPADAPRIVKETKAAYPDGVRAYGADALRFTLTAMAAQGRDIKLSLDRVEGYRNFATKLWNATRFAEMNECVARPDFDPRTCRETLNRWIAGELERTATSVTTELEAFRFNEAAGAVYRFIWNTFCDWYLELAKPTLNASDEAAKAETRAATAWVIDETLKLLHPFMPFLTEELWEKTSAHGHGRETLLALAPWPTHRALADAEADAEIGWLIKLVGEIRSVRAEMNVPAGARTMLEIVGAAAQTRARLARHEETLKRLARLDAVLFPAESSRGSVALVVEGENYALPLAGIIDVSAEAARLAREIAKTEKEMAKVEAKLANEQFLAKAEEHVIEEQRERKAAFEATLANLKGARKRLEHLG